MTESRVITVSGVVGAGKTTFIREMSEGLGIPSLTENVDGNELLPLMYNDPKRWATTLQVSFLQEKFAQMEEASRIGKCFVERTLYEDFIFMQTHRSRGNVSDVEWRVYKGMYDHFTKYVVKPDLMIFLDVPDELALARIESRNRPYEQGDANKELFLAQNQVYRDWIESYEYPKVIVDNATFDYINNASHRQQMMNYINLFLEEGVY